MWQTAAVQAAGQWLQSSEAQSSRPVRSGVEALAYSADGYTVATGGARASGAAVTKVPGDMAGVMSQGVGAVSANPMPYALAAVGIVLVVALMRRRKG